MTTLAFRRDAQTLLGLRQSHIVGLAVLTTFAKTYNVAWDH